MKTIPLLLLGLTLAGAVSLRAADFTLPTKGTMGKTTITSQTLEMVSGANENIFYFSKNVHVVGTNLDMKADQMVVTAGRASDSETPKAPKPSPSAFGANADAGQMGSIKKIVGVGNVHIVQEGRDAQAGRAEFFPKQGKVVLTENPRVVDSQAIVSGWRITLTQGEKKVSVEQNPEGGARPTVDLQAMPNLGYDSRKAEKEKPVETVKAVTKAGVEAGK